MLKFVDTLVSFQEIPDEIALCINISNCPNNCPGCHSAYLAEDIGDELTSIKLQELIYKNHGITCVCLMGGDNDPQSINQLAFSIKLRTNGQIKVAWYSCKQELSYEIALYNFDYIKLGPYIAELGPLTSKTTNQVMLKIDHEKGKDFVKDITSRFWKYES